MRALANAYPSDGNASSAARAAYGCSLGMYDLPAAGAAPSHPVRLKAASQSHWTAAAGYVC
jgi:hypothetical protein